MTTEIVVGGQVKLERAHLPHLFVALQEKGYTLLAPTVRDQAIVYDEVESVEELPIGWTDEQDNGRYRLKRRPDAAVFGYVVGPQSWKKFLHVPRQKLWHASQTEAGLTITEEPLETPRYAFIGVRPCELAAIAIQDKVFMGGPYVDPHYQARRQDNFIVAVNCGQAGGTCFCVSMNTGPQATSGFDLALTEICTPQEHFFVVEAGSPAGAQVLAQLPCEAVTPAEGAQAQTVVEQTRQQMGRSLNTTNLKEKLYQSYEHPRWNEVAQQCLSCANCTMVCPTCFCVTVEDVTDLTGQEAERARVWDSCFTNDFSYIHGGSLRPNTRARYRQWLTHKLASWQDQFGTSGCVGCGRCITWCPVGLDITAEAKAIVGEI